MTTSPDAGAGALESEAFYRAIVERAWLNDVVEEDGRYVRDCRVALQGGWP